MKRHDALLWRVGLALVVLAATWQGSVQRVMGGTATRGLTLVVTPSSLPPRVASQVTIGVRDSSGRLLSGTAIAVSGATISGPRTTGSTLLLVRITPTGTGPVLVTATHAGYVTVQGQVRVIAASPPALVSALSPTLHVLASGVTLSRPATLHEALQFQWRAVAGPTDRGSLTFADGSVLDLDHNTVVLIKSPTRTFLQTGQVFLQVVVGGQSHDLETGSAVAVSLGTRYLVSTIKGKTTIVVLSGRVTVRNGGKVVSVGANQQSTLQGPTAPSAPKHVNAGSLAAWAAGLPLVPDAALAHLAYLLLDNGSVLATYSIDNQQIVSTNRLPVPGLHIAVSRENDNLYIATRLGIVDVPLHGGKIHILNLGLNAVDLASLPGHRLAVADVGGERVVILNALAGVRIGSIPLGYTPAFLAASTDGRTVVVGGTGEVSLVDAVHDAVLTTRDITGSIGRPTIAPDGSLAYVPLLQTNQVAVLSLAARDIIAILNLKAPGSQAAAATSTGHTSSSVVGSDGRVYVLDAALNAIDVVDPSTTTVVARYLLPARPLSLALTQDGKLMTITTHPSLALIVDPTDGTIVSQVGVVGASGPVALPPPISENTASGANPQLAGSGSNTLVISSVPTVETIQMIPQQFNITATPTATATSTATASPTLTSLPSATATSTPTLTAVATDTMTATPTPSLTATATITPTVTLSPTATATATCVPTVTYCGYQGQFTSTPTATPLRYIIFPVLPTSTPTYPPIQ